MGKRKHYHPNSGNFEINEKPSANEEMQAKSAKKKPIKAAASASTTASARQPSEPMPAQMAAGSRIGRIAHRLAEGVGQAVSLGRAAIDLWRHRHDEHRSQ